VVNFVRFPALSNANEDGVLAMGGDLSVDTLVSAYSQGIFPWFNDDQPILWWSPDPRLVLYPDQLKMSKSLAKLVRQRRFEVTCDEAFQQVVQCCALRGSANSIGDSADGDTDTWITQSMHDAYSELFNRGYAHSIEVWQTTAGQRHLVGGLYGVVLGKVFFGESMFSEVNNTSKIALFSLCLWLQKLEFDLIDCQVASEHLLSLGAREIPRDVFLSHLKSINIAHASSDFSNDFKT
jgi:leucyl/phenylalanyl-tRNA--protein transferase